MGWFKRLFSGGRPRGPRLVITALGATMRVDADWPDPRSLSMEEANDNANALVAISNILTRGDGTGLALIQEAVGHTAKVRDEENFGTYVVKTLNQMSPRHRPGDDDGPGRDGPTVSVWDVFPNSGSHG